MTEQEILNILNQHEWKDVEFKEARTAVPTNAYESVSAFCQYSGRASCVWGKERWG